MEKRGDVGFTLTNLLIALFVLVVVGLGIFYFVKRGGEVGQNIPSNVEIITQACNLVASEQFKESYCNQIRAIGKNKYITCDHAVKKEGLTITNSENMKTICSGSKVQRINQQVTDMNLKNDTEINGETVKAWKDKLMVAGRTQTCVEGGGVQVCETDNLCKPEENVIVGTFTDVQGTQVCCKIACSN